MKNHHAEVVAMTLAREAGLPDWSKVEAQARLAFRHAAKALIDANAPVASVVPLCFRYKNWRGETSMRSVIPISVTFEANEWHPQPQWLLHGHDLAKGARRTFAMANILCFREPGDCHPIETWEGSNAFPGNDPGPAVSADPAPVASGADPLPGTIGEALMVYHKGINVKFRARAALDQIDALQGRGPGGQLNWSYADGIAAANIKTAYGKEAGTEDIEGIKRWALGVLNGA